MSQKFSKRFLNEVLGFTKEETELVMKAQKIFPEMITEDLQGFVIDGRTLWLQLQSKRKFADWMKNNISRYKYVENIDFFSFHKKVKRETGATTITEYKLTLNCAKKIAIRQNNDMGNLICDYFILMEKAVKGMQNHLIVREPEKAGYNEMKEYIAGWYARNYPGSKINPYVFAKEADMLNIALMGQSAKNIKELLEFNDVNTREHLKIEINKALYELQILNSSLLIANMDFQQRKNIIEATCEAKYDVLRLKINEELKNTKQLENINN